MGQTIEINKTTVIDRVLMIDTDRTLAGQDGEAYGTVEAARRSTTFPAKLAARILEADPAADHVFVMSNQVSVRRPGGWDDAAVAAVAGLVSDFFRIYPDA
ncbi:MAG: hypothetical protein R3246_04860 [Acidimicrobiia bacterium]|nr:hypothetical protein [Acidimicrobiia bacterium]